MLSSVRTLLLGLLSGLFGLVSSPTSVVLSLVRYISLLFFPDASFPAKNQGIYRLGPTVPVCTYTSSFLFNAVQGVEERRKIDQHTVG